MAIETQKHDKSSLTLPLLASAVVTFLGSSLPVGYNIGVINTPQLIIKKFCNQSIIENYGVELSDYGLDNLWASVVSVYIVGGTIGSLSGSWLADMWGRKGGILVNNILGVAAAILFLSAPAAMSVEMLFLARFLAGLSSGLTTSIVPMYMTEIVSIDLRGPMGVLCPLGITLGVLISQILGLEFLLGSSDRWHFLLALYGAPTLLCMLALPYLPESPKYLYVIKKMEQKSGEALSRLRGRPVSALTLELQEMRMANLREMSTGQWSIIRLIKSETLRWPLLLVCAMQAGQQLSGINAVFYYSVPIFMSAGLGEEGSQYASIGAGVVNFLVAVLATFLIGRLRRRTMMLFSCLTAISCLLILCVSIYFMKTISWMPYLSIAAVLAYVFFYGVGLGPIPYFVASELFTVGPRPAAMALGSMSNWGANFLVGMAFPSIQSAIQGFSFLPFATCTALLAFLLWKKLPETYGVDPAEPSELDSEEIALQSESPKDEPGNSLVS